MHRLAMRDQRHRRFGTVFPIVLAGERPQVISPLTPLSGHLAGENYCVNRALCNFVCAVDGCLRCFTLIKGISVVGLVPVKFVPDRFDRALQLTWLTRTKQALVVSCAISHPRIACSVSNVRKGCGEGSNIYHVQVWSNWRSYRHRQTENVDTGP